MVWLLIGLAMVMIAGPIMWLRPNKRERRLANMRQQAFMTGGKCHPINIRKDSFYQKTLARNPHLADYPWIRYEWVANEQQTGPEVKDRWVQRRTQEGELVWEPNVVTSQEYPALTNMLKPWRDQQDGRFLSVELGPRSVAVVWTEQGDQETVDNLAQQVQTLLG